MFVRFLVFSGVFGGSCDKHRKDYKRVRQDFVANCSCSQFCHSDSRISMCRLFAYIIILTTVDGVHIQMCILPYLVNSLYLVSRVSFY